MRDHTSIAAFGSNFTKIIFMAGILSIPVACVDATEQPGAGPEAVTDVSAERPAIIPGDEDCATANAWVIANQASLPTAYDDVTRFPVVYRRAIFDHLSQAAQSSLWQEHFQAYLAARPDLSAEQIAFVHELGAAVSPELFAHEAGTAASEDMLASIAALEAEALALFTHEEARDLLARLGPDEPTRDYSTEQVDCHCSTVSDWCDNNLDCKGGARDCKQEGGCGRLWMYTCDGMCGP